MFLEVPAGDLHVGRVEPFDLAEASAGCLKVGEIYGPGLVVVGEVADLPPFGRNLDDGEG